MLSIALPSPWVSLLVRRAGLTAGEQHFPSHQTQRFFQALCCSCKTTDVKFQLDQAVLAFLEPPAPEWKGPVVSPGTARCGDGMWDAAFLQGPS